MTVLFDMDGVIIDTRKNVEKFWTRWAELYSKPADEIAKNCHGIKAESFLDQYFPEISAQQKKEILDDAYQTEKVQPYKAVKGVIDFLKLLKEEGNKCGLVTSASNEKVEVVLKTLSLNEIFDIIVTSYHITKGKPDPEAYILAAKNLNVDCSECIVFEDSLAGTLAAKKAGMYVIGVTTTHNKEELIHADYHISDFEKLNIDVIRKCARQNVGMKILNLAKQVKAISETGLIYQQNEYDRERYEQVRAISLNIISTLSGVSIDILKSFYLPVHDYPTPKVDVRGFVLNESRDILMVKEKIDGKWTIPGGWADVGLSPSEVVEKEIIEETGLEVKVDRLCAVFDKKCHPHPPQPFYVYKLVFLCSVVGGSVNPDFDIEDVGWFSINNLPELSTDRILRSQIEKVYEKVISKEMTAIFD